jgi:hypothetical protein
MLALAFLAVAGATMAAATPCPPIEGAEALSATVGCLSKGAPEYRFCVYGSIDNGVAWLDLLQVYAARDVLIQDLAYPQELQTLGLFSVGEFPNGWPAPLLEDLNFDGYLDVKLMSYLGGTGNYGFNVWIYRPESRRFVHEPTLSQLGRLKAHPETRTLTSSWVMGAGTSGHSVLRWEKGVPVVVRDETLDWNKDLNCQELIITERQHGRLMIIRQGCVDAK